MLAVGSAGDLGNSPLTINGGTLEATGTFTFGQGISLGSAGGTIEVQPGNTLTLSGNIGGSGGLNVAFVSGGSGGETVALSGSNSYSGSTTITTGATLERASGSAGPAARSTTTGPSSSPPGASRLTLGNTITGSGRGDGQRRKRHARGRQELLLRRHNDLQWLADGKRVGGTPQRNDRQHGLRLAVDPHRPPDDRRTFRRRRGRHRRQRLRPDVNTGYGSSGGSSGGFAGVISGNGSLAISGGGTQTLTGTNTYTGGTTITSVVLAVGSAGNLGNGPLTINGGTLEATGTFTLARTFPWAAPGGRSRPKAVL